MRSILLPWLLCLFLAAPVRAAEVLVFAAASLAGPLDAVIAAYAAETDHQITVSYGASSSLARQIAAGAPADIVILASDDWMDDLAARGLLVPETRRTLVGNTLVLIGTANATPVPFTDLATRTEGRIALALTEAVPAGIYARASLEATDQWAVVRPRLTETDNVRAALQLVALGAAPYGIVYATDAAFEPRVQVLSAIPEALHPPIRYPVAVTANASAAALQFAQALHHSPAQDIFAQAGFTQAPR